jgi:hypothetical protein
MVFRKTTDVVITIIILQFLFICYPVQRTKGQLKSKHERKKENEYMRNKNEGKVIHQQRSKLSFRNKTNNSNKNVEVRQ